MPKPAKTLLSLAADPDPLSAVDSVVDVLRNVTAESRFVEWKAGGLFGAKATIRTKYRAVKAAISLANADGGFVLFGVQPSGTWSGLSDDEFKEFDPAKVTELINGVVFPDLPVINYAQFSYDTKSFAVIHVPPSPLVPHATTRDITEIDSGGIRRLLVAKNTVYYRHGGKSDSATPLQLQRIVEKRTLHVRDELVRRVREIPVPVIGKTSAATSTTGTTMTVARLTDDPDAPAIRLTRIPGQANGVFMHEELSNGLFDEINNVLDANALLAGASSRFVFGDEIYYRVYAERHHVQGTNHPELLLRTAFREIYAPLLFWLTTVTPKYIAEELLHSIKHPKHPVVLSAFKTFVLLGEEPTAWLDRTLDKQYRRITQKPEFYWTFKKMMGRRATERRLMALRTSGSSTLDIPAAGAVTYSELIGSPEDAAAHLSRLCMRIFQAEGAERTLARQLDIAAYGKQVEERGADIWKAIREAERV